MFFFLNTNYKNKTLYNLLDELGLRLLSKFNSKLNFRLFAFRTLIVQLFFWDNA